jgi:isoleucyl-tRNA synthetase
VHLSAKANFRALGPRFGKDVKDIATAIAALDHEAVDRLVDGETVDVAGHPITIDDVTVNREPRGGVVVAGDVAFSVALDTELSDDLVREGVAREVINRIQTLRREAGLEVSDRIELRWHSADPAVREAVTAHTELIAGEVLAAAVIETDDTGGPVASIGDAEIVLGVRPA